MDREKVILINEQPFYAYMLQQCVLIWTEQVQTAGVRINQKGQVELAVSKKYFYGLPERNRVGLLMHEMLHLMMDHFTRGKGLQPRLANVAMDIAINQFIPSDMVHEAWLTPDKFDFEPNRAFEVYYLELIDQQNKLQEKIQKALNQDNHDWQDQGTSSSPVDGAPDANKTHSDSQPGKGKDGDKDNDVQSTKGSGSEQEQSKGDGQNDQSPKGGELTEELKKAVIEGLVRKAMAESEKSKPGSTPMHIRHLVDQIFAPPKVRWERELRNYAGRAISKQYEPTRNRANRRLGFMAEGKKYQYTPRIILAFDESGSVSDEMRGRLISEARGIFKHVSDKVEVLFFDTQIAHVEKLDSLKTMPPRRACGGTSFQCVIDYANATKQRADLVIICTDADAPCPTKPRFPVVWAIAGRSSGEHLFGKKIYIDELDR